MKILRTFFQTTGIFCASFTFFDCIGCPMSIAGTSMMPTINAGEIIWTSKVSLEPKKDDIFVFTSPANPSKNHIKRVVGLPGDLVNNKQGEGICVPEHHFWMLSDNTSCPTVHDSRAYGAVHHGLLRAKATHLIWPPSRWSSLKNSKGIDDGMNATKIPI